jgi:hypothetical protein
VLHRVTFYEWTCPSVSIPSHIDFHGSMMQPGPGCTCLRKRRHCSDGTLTIPSLLHSPQCGQRTPSWRVVTVIQLGKSRWKTRNKVSRCLRVVLTMRVLLTILQGRSPSLGGPVQRCVLLVPFAELAAKTVAKVVPIPFSVSNRALACLLPCLWGQRPCRSKLGDINSTHW